MAVPIKKGIDAEMENYLLYGIDPKHRRIFFGVPINTDHEDTGSFKQGSVEIAVRGIFRMLDEHPSKPIEIHMNSYGGDTCAMLYWVDLILSSGCQFKFYGGGAVMSSATFIMAVCDERYLYPNAAVLCHETSDDGGSDKHTDQQIDAEHSSYFMDKLCEIYTENSFMPKEFWADVCQRDLNLSAQEAIQLGLADFMIEYKKRGNLRKKRQARMSKPPSKRLMNPLIKKLYKRVKMNLPNQELKLHIPEPALNDPNVIVDNSPIEEVVETTKPNGTKSE